MGVGLLHDAVRQVRDAWGVDDADEVEFDAPWIETVQQADTAAEMPSVTNVYGGSPIGTVSGM